MAAAASGEAAIIEMEESVILSGFSFRNSLSNSSADGCAGAGAVTCGADVSETESPGVDGATVS